MNTAGKIKASTVIMDCRDEPGKDNGKSPSLWDLVSGRVCDRRPSAQELGILPDNQANAESLPALGWSPNPLIRKHKSVHEKIGTGLALSRSKRALCEPRARNDKGECQ
jgi:hypothetical protein